MTAARWVMGVIGGLFLIGQAPAGQLAFGPQTRDQFEQWRQRLDDSYVDFEGPSFASGPLGPVVVDGVTLTFTTTLQRYPIVASVSYPVYLIPYGGVNSRNGTRTLMGIREYAGFQAPDGQSRYEIVFSEPQGRVGLMRLWNTSAITRFYNPDGVLLGEHQNTTANEFVAWMAGGPEISDWVARVEIDGLNAGGAYQVGETDEIYFGSSNPNEPGMIGLVYGPEAESVFQLYREVFGDALVDFEEQPVGPMTILELPEYMENLSFKTTEKRYPQPTIPVDYPVAVLPYGGVSSPGGGHSLMGAGSPNGAPDGQNPYSIEFEHVQHRVGLMRRWNTSSITRFLAEDGSLLDEHQNTTNHEFVGYVGDPEDEGTWVKTIVIDGATLSGTYQVGATDDLFFGRNLPDQPDIQITGLVMVEADKLIINWEPKLMLHDVEFSNDLQQWAPIDGELSSDQWMGPYTDGGPVFFRVVADNPFR